VHNPTHKHGKLGLRDTKMVFIRYLEHSKGYVMGVHPQSPLGETCLLRILNQRTRKFLYLRFVDMRIDLILMNPWPKGLAGVILLLVKVLYLERKGGGILSRSRRYSQVLCYFKGVSPEEFLVGFSKSKRTFSSACLWREKRFSLM